MSQNVNSDAQKQVFDVLFQRNKNLVAMNCNYKSIIPEADIDDSYILNELSKLPEPSELWESEVSDAAKQGDPWKQQYNDNEIKNEGKLMQYKKADTHRERQQLLENFQQHPIYDAGHSKIQGTSLSHNTHALQPASYLSSGLHITGDSVWGQKFQQPLQQGNDNKKQFQKVNVESESRHMSALAKKREVCRNNARLLKNQLNSLKVQRNELRGDGTRSPSPETMNYLKENTKMQLEIQKKLKAIDKVVKMLGGIIAEESPETRSTDFTAHPRAPSKKQHQFNYVHYDPEMYWCHLCNDFPKTAEEYLNHLHTDKHQTNAAEHSETPWNILSGFDEGFPTIPSAPSKRTPIKGLQFFVPSMAWFCKLCNHFMGDLQCASTHLKSIIHTKNYNAYVEHNPHWETDWVSDRQKAFEKFRNKEIDDDPSASPIKAKKKRKTEPAIYISSSSPSSDSEGETHAKRGKHDKYTLNLNTSDPRVDKELTSIEADFLDRGDRKMVENLQIKIKLDKSAELGRHGSDSNSKSGICLDMSRDSSHDRQHIKKDRDVPRDRPDDRRDRRDFKDRRYENRRDNRDKRYDSRSDDRDRRYDRRIEDRDRWYDDRCDNRDRRHDDRRTIRHDGRKDAWRLRHDDRSDKRRSSSRGDSVDDGCSRDTKRESEEDRGKFDISKTNATKMDLNKVVIIGKMPSLQHAAVDKKEAIEKEKAEEQVKQEREKDEKEIQELAAALLANPYLFPPVPVPVPPSDVTPDINCQDLYPGLNVGFHPFPPGMMTPAMGPMMNPGGVPGVMPPFPGQGLLGPGPMIPFGMNQPFMPHPYMPMYNNARGPNRQRRIQNNHNNYKKKQNQENSNHGPTEVGKNEEVVRNGQNQMFQKIRENEEKIIRDSTNTNQTIQNQNDNDPHTEQIASDGLHGEKLGAHSLRHDNNQKAIDIPNGQADTLIDDKINNLDNLKQEPVVPEYHHTETHSMSNQSDEDVVKCEHNDENK